MISRNLGLIETVREHKEIIRDLAIKLEQMVQMVETEEEAENDRELYGS